MKHYVMALLATLMCQQALAETPAADAPSSGGYITFIDSKLFDGQLYDQLSKKPEKLEIVMPGHVSLTNFSPRLDRWLTIIGENGQMTLQETPEPPKLTQRALFALIPIVYSMVGEAREAMVNAEAKRYNAMVYYHKDDMGNAIVDRMVLTRKP